MKTSHRFILAGVYGLLAVVASFSVLAEDINPAPMLTVPVVIYGAENSTNVPPYAPSGWMGKFDAIELDDVSKDLPHSGEVCMKITFSDAKDWGGIVWQHPPNNWGTEEGGYHLYGARQLSFWARGAAGTERIEVKFGILKDKLYSDSTQAVLGHIRLSKIWRHFSIPLAGKNLSRIVTPLCISFAGTGKPFSFYLDDIVIE
ncbi:MAG TPA: hypothetical protein DCZ95_10885 [Verrucomicrobia bacterium]|nr:MAG: hypothetical protein A2X46_08105 [Lentisphaerae bacterium GWF2_57_35]HBA84589.1 hypothetical protein [Verrucomicrobiota bacterium]